MSEKTKTCKYCGATKVLSDFDKNKTYADGYSNKCKACRLLYGREYRQKNVKKIKRSNAQYYEKNKNEINKKSREYYAKHKSKILEYATKYRSEHKEERSQYFKRRYADNKEKLLADMKEYREKHREEKIEYLRKYYNKNKKKLLKQQYEKKKERLRNDLNFKLKEQARLLVWRSFNRKGQVKPSRSEAILGCSLDDFTEYLKRTWLEEYHTEWVGQPCHIDHIRPLASAKTKDDILKWCHYSNLRLLTPEDNIKKSIKDRTLKPKSTIIETKGER